MHNIHHNFIIKAPKEKVFEAVSEPNQLDKWWTRASSGVSDPGEVYRLNFGPEFHWQAEVSVLKPEREFELTFTDSDDDWNDTKVNFKLFEQGDKTYVEFSHTGWMDKNEHFMITSFCWAMYLRLLKKLLENGDVIPYKDRLEA